MSKLIKVNQKKIYLAEDVLNRQKQLQGVSDYIGKTVSDTDGIYHYINDFGYTHKYVADSWENNDDSCPSDSVNISSSAFGKFYNSVDMVSGQPCGLAGKNIQNKSTDEHAWVDIKGSKHVYSDSSMRKKLKGCDVNVIKLDGDKYDKIPEGTPMTNTTVCDQLGVNPQIWVELTNLNEELIMISKKIQNEMSKLRTQDQEFKKQIADQKNLLSQYVTALEKEKKMINNQEGGMDMATVTGSYDDSILNRRQKNYRYLAWSFVAFKGSAFFVRQLLNCRN